MERSEKMDLYTELYITAVRAWLSNQTADRSSNEYIVNAADYIANGIAEKFISRYKKLESEE